MFIRVIAFQETVEGQTFHLVQGIDHDACTQGPTGDSAAERMRLTIDAMGREFFELPPPPPEALKKPGAEQCVIIWGD